MEKNHSTSALVNTTNRYRNNYIEKRGFDQMIMDQMIMVLKEQTANIFNLLILNQNMDEQRMDELF